MGEQNTQTSEKQSLKAFSYESAKAASALSALPHIYEKEKFKGDLNGFKDTVNAEYNDIEREYLHVIVAGDVTAVMTLNTNNHNATVAFDPTHTLGDKLDNFFRKEKDHSLGGKVHGGIYSDIVKDRTISEKFPGSSLTDVIGAILHSYANQNPEKSLNVDFTGFSSGGAKAAMTAGEMIAEGFFKDYPNIQLQNVYTFSPPGYANNEFIEKFEQATEQLGANSYMVQIHGDTTPSILTSDASGLFTKYHYGQAGDHIYIIPSETGEPQMLINPSQETLDALPEPEHDKKEVHTLKAYQYVLTTDNSTEITPQPLTNTPSLEP